VVDIDRQEPRAGEVGRLAVFVLVLRTERVALVDLAGELVGNQIDVLVGERHPTMILLGCRLVDGVPVDCDFHSSPARGRQGFIGPPLGHLMPQFRPRSAVSPLSYRETGRGRPETGWQQALVHPVSVSGKDLHPLSRDYRLTRR